MTTSAAALELLRSVEAMLGYYEEHEPERLERAGMIRVVGATLALADEVANEGEALSDPDADAEGMARRNGPTTSQLAAWALFPRSGTQRRLVLDAFVEAGPDGLTYDEAVKATGLGTYDRVGPRVRELRDGGWIIDSGYVRDSDLGEDSAVWILTPVAYERLRDGTDDAPLDEDDLAEATT